MGSRKFGIFWNFMANPVDKGKKGLGLGIEDTVRKRGVHGVQDKYLFGFLGNTGFWAL